MAKELHSPFIQAHLSMGQRVLLVLILLLSLLGVHLSWSFHETNRSELERLQTILRVIDANLAQSIIASNAMLEKILDDIQLYGLPAILERKDYLQLLVNVAPGIRSSLITDKHGKIISASRSEVLGRDINHRDYFSTPKFSENQDLLFISRPFKTFLGVYTINISRILKDVDGNFNGVISVTLEPEFFKSAINAARYADDVSVAFLHQDGDLFLLVPETTSIQNENLINKNTEFRKHFLSGSTLSVQEGISYFNKENSISIILSNNYPNLHADKGLYISIARKQSAVMAQWQHSAISELGLYIILCIIMLMIANIAQRRQNDWSKSQSLNNIIINNTYEGIYGVDVRGKINFINQKAENLLGWSSQELIGKDDHATLHFLPKDSNSTRPAICPVQLTLEDGLSRYSEDVCFISKSGKKIPVEFSVTARIENKTICGAIIVFHDISKRKFAEHLMRENKERLALATASAQIGVWEYQLATQRLTWDEHMFKLFDINPLNFNHTYEDWRSAIHPDDLSTVEQKLLRAIQHIGVFEDSFRIKIMNNSIRYIKSHGQVYADEHGIARRIVGISFDITDRILAEEELREAQARFRSAFDAAAIGMALVDSNGYFILTNKALWQLTGYSEQELTEITIHDITYHDDLTKDSQQLEHLKNNEYSSYRIEKRYYHRDGSIVWVQLTASAVHTQEGKFLYYIAQIEDISERKREEQQLRMAMSVIETTGESVYLLDEHGYILYANPAAHSLLGYSAGELERFIIQSIDNNYEKNINHALLGTQRIYSQYRHKSGHLIPVETFSNTINNQQDSISVAIVCHDISEQQKNEQLLKQAKQLAEAASAAKSQFLANMSHEIRTPMNAIIGLLHLLKNTALSKQQVDYADKAHSAAKSLLSILNDILDFSKIEANKITLEHTTFNLYELFKELSLLIYGTPKEKNINIFFDLPDDLPQNLLGDPLRLQQILLNLSGNAIKFTEQGEVTISAKLINRTNNHGLFEFSVQDTGIGIAADQLDNIFNGFSQAEASTSRRFGGSGLGLAISNRLVRLMGGKITVTSTLGIGSRFSFNITLGIPAEQPSIVSPSIQHTVLVLSDYPPLSDWITRVLTPIVWVCEQHEFLYLEKNLESLLQSSNIILIDCNSIQLNHLSKNILCHAELLLQRNSKLIILSNYENPLLSDSTKTNLIDAVLSKPCTANMLIHCIQTVSNQSRSSNLGSHTISILPRLSGLRFLLVEDNTINQQVASEILHSEGAMVIVASNGQEALEILHTDHQFDAVLMDIHMPMMDGYSATHAIRQQLKLGKLPIIAMTASALLTDRTKALEAGMNGHIAKPIEVETLVTTLLQLCQRPIIAPNKLQEFSSAEELGQTGSITLHSALQRFLGNRLLYGQMARRFCLEKAGLFADIQTALADDDLSAAYELVHGLKGVAATLGADHLAANATAVEDVLRQSVIPDTDTLQHLQQALLEASQTLATLAEQFAPLDKPSKPTTLSNMAQLSTKLQLLVNYLQHGDLAALDLFSQLQEQYAGALEFGALEDALNQLNLSAAIVCTQQLLAALNTTEQL